VRTKQPPYRAVQWVPDVGKSGRPTLRGRRWEEILRSGSTDEPETFFAEAVEVASPMEYLTYPPKKDAPICGWWMAEEGVSESGARVLIHKDRYCPRPTVPGQLCKRHEAEFAALPEEPGEEPDD